MMRLIIVAVAGLLTGIGGGIAAAWLRKPDTPPAVNAAAATDSTAAPVDCMPAVAADSSSVVTDSTQTKAIATITPGPTVAPRAVRETTSAVADTAASNRERLVNIMAAMKPTDAARALVSLDDAQVEAVLFGLSERKAAAILSSFPAERAAKLMQSILIRRS